MHPLKRREFVGGLAALGGWIAIPSAVARAAETIAAAARLKKPAGPLLVAAGSKRKTDRLHWNTNHPGRLDIIALETNAYSKIDVSCTPHVWNQHPTLPHILFGVTKQASKGCVVDMNAMELDTTIHAPTGYRFYGHACFDPKGEHVFVTAQSRTFPTGQLLIYDCKGGKNWKLIDRVESGGLQPHECLIGPDGKMYVVNDMTPNNPQVSSVGKMDLKDGKIEHVYQLPTTASHGLFVGSELVLCGYDGDPKKHNSHLLSLNLETGVARDVHKAHCKDSLELTGEALSLAKVSDHEVVVTIPDATCVLRWNLATNQAKLMPVPDNHPLGVVTFNDQLYINTDENLLFRVKPGALPQTFASSSAWKPEYSDGRHLRVFTV